MTDRLVIGGQLGNYLIESVIGRGGMSVVYRATHSRLGMSVALKVLAPELSSDDAFRERFLREAQMAAAVDHPSVIPIHDMGVHENSLYIVMRYVAGGDLKALLTTDAPLAPDVALMLLTPVALALDAAHAHGLVHRDVKPANILLQRSAGGEVDHVYLTDFGIAKSASGTGLTSTGAFIGTVEYMAPEQLEGRDVSARTDVYALAATLYECVTGRIPSQRELAASSLRAQGAEGAAGLPAGLDVVVVKALSPDPADRYVTCEQFLRACSYALEREPPAAQSVVPPAIGATRPSGDVPAPAPAAEPAPSSIAEPAPSPVSQSPDVPPGPGADSPPSGPKRGRRPVYAGLLVAAVAVAAAIIVLASGSGHALGGRLSSSGLLAVPTNRVIGSGYVSVRLIGDDAYVTVTTKNLDNDAPLVHLMHIHAGGKGECPPASAARPHNGHLAISTTDGEIYYGPPVQALTTRGDTSVASILVFPRYLTGGDLRYERTIKLPPAVAAEIRDDNAVIVVHGIDYDGSGIYDGVLDRSELNKNVPATATAPALCGHLVGAPEVAATGSSRRGALYTASLGQTPPLEEAFYCQVPPTIAAIDEALRSSAADASRAGHATALG